MFVFFGLFPAGAITITITLFLCLHTHVKLKLKISTSFQKYFKIALETKSNENCIPNHVLLPLIQSSYFLSIHN